MKIRLAGVDDAADILGIYAPFIRETAISFETEIPSVEEFAGRIEKILGHSPWLVMEDGGKIAGYAYANEYRVRDAYRWTREVSIYVDPGWHRRGVATALYDALEKFLVLQGYTNALASITVPNEPSVRFHESFGFRKVGIMHNVGYKLDRYQDMGWWEKQLSGSGEKPSAIKSVAETAAILSF